MTDRGPAFNGTVERGPWTALGSEMARRDMEYAVLNSTTRPMTREEIAAVHDGLTVSHLADQEMARRDREWSDRYDELRDRMWNSIAVAFSLGVGIGAAIGVSIAVLVL